MDLHPFYRISLPFMEPPIYVDRWVCFALKKMMEIDDSEFGRQMIQGGAPVR